MALLGVRFGLGLSSGQVIPSADPTDVTGAWLFNENEAYLLDAENYYEYSEAETDPDDAWLFNDGEAYLLDTEEYYQL